MPQPETKSCELSINPEWWDGLLQEIKNCGYTLSPDYEYLIFRKRGTPRLKDQVGLPYTSLEEIMPDHIEAIIRGVPEPED